MLFRPVHSDYYFSVINMKLIVLYSSDVSAL